MTEQAETETDWKLEYRALVREIEVNEHAWREAESMLRRACTQMAIAAMGQDATLDRSLESVVEALRGAIEPAALKDELESLAEALRQSPRGTGSTAADADIARLMREIVARVAAMPVFRDASQSLTETMEQALADRDRPAVASGLVDTIERVTTAIERQKRELETFLEEVTAQLEHLESWHSWNREASAARLEESTALEAAVGDEMRGIRSAVDDADDVASLKRRVQARLEGIAAGFTRFREHETARQSEAEARNAALTAELDILRDRTKKLSQAVENKETQLLYDTLTGVHSRYAYEQRLAEEFHRWQRHRGHLAFAIWDIDLFKSVNDRLGHAAGDRLLRLIARELANRKRREDFLARIGGEEFVLLLPATSAGQAAVLADRMRLGIARTPFHFHGVREQVTISCGLTEFRDGDSPGSVYERADAALYRAKAAGRNRCTTG